MKKIKLIILGIILPLMSFAQTIDDIGKIVIGVRILPTATIETLEIKDYLVNKLTNLVANAGYSSFNNNTFYITPSISINETHKAEGGMKNIYVLSGDIYLKIQDNNNEIVFSSISYPFKGSGTSEIAAIKNGIQKINYFNINRFFDDAKKSILNYYYAMQDKIFAKADMLSKNHEYDAAIACLLTIPEELFDINKIAYSKACDIYKERDLYIAEQIATEISEHNNCVLVKAQSLLASHDSKGTLQTLWEYHIANTEQDEEYYQLLKIAETQITAKEKADLEKEKLEYEERRMKEEREYLDKKQAYKDEINLRNRQLDLEYKQAGYESENKRDTTEVLKTIALEYHKNNNTY